ncbi:folate-binding protein [Palleronia sediminis]|uniref:Folate-binding protein n=1 Tax=Palleronia sediminis TaxID=2547833 RepID=A0A4R6ANZ1_9RHOB|nr:folate-binding protein YgfZ [Palleronia sediminis]TDL84308.1 folate-binding protein [Palleronia sediminis]
MTDPRRIIALSGPERVDFLQDLVTNDIRRSEGLTYAALLTPQGKYLADFFVAHDGAGDDGRLLIDVAASQADGLLARLNMYKLRRKVEIAAIDLGLGRGLGPAPEGAHADPRHPDMGWRAIGGRDGAEPVDWDALRVRLGIPQAGIELIAGESFILELGFERLNGVDYRKGCFVGQEIVARMHHKTELRKGLVRVALSGDAAPGTTITAEGRPAGTLHTVSGDRALAYLRFDRADGPLDAGGVELSLEEKLI